MRLKSHISAMLKEQPPPAHAPWPPILVAATIAIGLSLDMITGLSLPIIQTPHARFFGLTIIALALANDIWCALAFRRHRTTIMPHRSASALITEGPFRYSRNPIYISHIATTFGIALLLGSLFTALLTPALALALNSYAVEPEERHLEATFGEAYRDYMARTRRWL